MSIFDGTQPPAWLSNIARPADMSVAAKDIGMVLGGALNAIQRDPKAPAEDPQTGEAPSWLSSRKGFQEGLSEARMNQIDPLMQLRSEQMKSGLLGSIINNEQNFQQLKVGNEERQSWLQALPGMTKWLTARPEERADMPTPDPKGSTQAISIIDKIRAADDNYFLRKQSNDIRMANSKALLEDQKRKQAWGDAAGALSPEAQSEIAALQQGGLRVDADGWYVDQNGRPTQPSKEALVIMNKDRAAQGLPRWGATREEMQKYEADKRAAAAKAATEARAKAAADKLAETTRHDQAMEVKGGVGGEPQFKKLENGQVVMWMPGGKGAHVLKDPKQEMQAKVAFENYKSARSEYSKAAALPGKPERLNSYKEKVDQALKQIDSLFQYQPDAAAPTAASGSSTNGVMTTPGGLKFRVISQ